MRCGEVSEVWPWTLVCIECAERFEVDLTRRGFYVESTGAVAWAAHLAVERARPTVDIVIALTGSGLKESQATSVR